MNHTSSRPSAAGYVISPCGADWALFGTSSGHFYAYHGGANRVYFCPPELTAAADSVIADRNPISVSLINEWLRSVLGPVQEPEPAYLAQLTKHSYLHHLDHKKLLHMILILTESCNMRCRYCQYSGHYQYSRTHNGASMDKGVAKRAIDFFLGVRGQDLPQDACWSGVQATRSIGFFGGEPLLQLDLLRYCIDYARSKKSDVKFSITTNGTMLRPDVVSVLADNEVDIQVSLDGPQPEHDRNRVYRNGRPTFDRIWTQLEAIRARYPEYFAQHVSVLAVYDWQTDMEQVLEFFARGDTPLLSRWSLANTSDTDYYRRFSEECRDRHREIIHRIQQRHWQLSLEEVGSRTSSEELRICDMVFGWDNIVKRKVRPDLRFPRSQYTATCLPGCRKLAVYPDGSLHVCEKINGAFPIGDVDTWIVFAKVAALMRYYYEQVVFTQKCERCVVRSMCSVCLANAGKDGRFAADSCEGMRHSVVHRLRLWSELLEKRPGDVDMRQWLSARHAEKTNLDVEYSIFDLDY